MGAVAKDHKYAPLKLYFSHFAVRCAWPSRTKLPFSSTMPIRKYQKLQCSKEFAKSKGDNDLHNKRSTIWPVKWLLLNRIKTHEVHWAQKTSYRQEHWTIMSGPFFSSSIALGKQKSCHFANYTFNRVGGRCYLENFEFWITYIYLPKNIYTWLWTVKDQKVLPTLCGYFGF